MARSTPRVEGGTLLGLDAQASAIAVGTPAWYAWLEEATTFAFTGEQGRFTARKERSGRSGWYWKAYRKREGTLHHAYLGKSADLTLDQLNAVAADLASRDSRPPKVISVGGVGPALDQSNSDLSLLTSAPLPTGTVTFLFTDIEGSTQHWEQHQEVMRDALARHTGTGPRSSSPRCRTPRHGNRPPQRPNSPRADLSTRRCRPACKLSTTPDTRQSPQQSASAAHSVDWARTRSGHSL